MTGGAPWRRVALGLAAVLLVCGPRPAAADFIVCNDGFDVVNLAIGHQEPAGFVTRGWWTVGPNRCATVIRDLAIRYVYVHATDVFGQMLLEGTETLCLDESRFEIRGTRECWRRGHVAAPFAEVDTGTARRWILFLGSHEGAG